MVKARHPRPSWIGASVSIFLLLTLATAAAVGWLLNHDRAHRLAVVQERQWADLSAGLVAVRGAGESLLRDLDFLIVQFEFEHEHEHQHSHNHDHGADHLNEVLSAYLRAKASFFRSAALLDADGALISGYSLEGDSPELILAKAKKGLPWDEVPELALGEVYYGEFSLDGDGNPEACWMVARWQDGEGRLGYLLLEHTSALLLGVLKQQNLYLLNHTHGRIWPAPGPLDARGRRLQDHLPPWWGDLRASEQRMQVTDEALISYFPMTLRLSQTMESEDGQLRHRFVGPFRWGLFAYHPKVDEMVGLRGVAWPYLGFLIAASFIYFLVAMIIGRKWGRQRALHQAQQKDRTFLLGLIDSLPLPVLFKDSEGRFVTINAAAAEFYGLPVHQLLGKTVSEVAPDRKVAQEIEAHDREFLASGRDEDVREVLFPGSMGQRRLMVYKTRLTDPETGKSGLLLALVDVTEERRLQAQRDEVVSRYQQIAAQIPGLLIQYQRLANGVEQVLFCSEASQVLFEARPEEICENVQLLWDRIHPEDRQAVRESLLSSGRTLQEWYREFRVVHTNGWEWWILGRARPRRLPDGSVIWDGFFNDLTRQKQAQLRAERDRDLIRSLFSSLTDHVSYKDPYGNYLGGNPAFGRFVGQPPESLIGKTDVDIFGPQIGETWLELDRKVAAERRTLRSEAIVTGKSGREVILDVVRSPILNRNGEVAGVLCISRDVTERVQAENHVREVTQRLDVATRAGEIGIWEYEYESGRIVWNDIMYEIFGVDRASFPLDFEKWAEMIHPEDLAAAIERARNAGPEEKTISLQSRIFRQPTGEVRFLRAVCRLFRNEEGKVRRVVGANWDATLTVEAEQKLILARDDAEKANRAKSEFLAVMSHEIRTPMNGVIGAASLMLNTDLSDQQRDYLRTIQVSGDNLLAIINDILDYSKIEAGRMELEASEFDLQQCLEDSLDLFAVEAARKGLELGVQVAPEVSARWVGDVTRLRQILVNLLSNGIKFTDAGQVVIYVAMEDAATLHFRVEDSGIGIPADRIDRLFKSFSQVDASNTRRFGGTGLGLAISKRLAETMGGTMWVESRPGAGATFHFTVKIPVAGAATMGAQYEERVPSKALRTAWVVMPNVVIGRMWAAYLERWGLRTRLFSDINTLRAEWTMSPECLIVDASVSYLLDEWPGDSRPARVLMAAHARDSHPKADEIVRKPIKPRQLWRAVFSRPDAAREVAAGAGSDGVPTSPLSILVAEDNLINQRVVRMMLSRLGYEPMVVANGIEAVMAFQEGYFDVILMDVQMPEMDGLMATRHIRTLSQDAELPWIIALTAGAMEGDRQNAAAAGMNDYLAKPIKIESLRDALRRAMQHSV
ncbi:MAG: PAS domain-containing protein [Verrucomicrobiota bacterium JB022]|nr:PAS domain-containing protein [Verrucomicrobiota bacterium JB022]